MLEDSSRESIQKLTLCHQMVTLACYTPGKLAGNIPYMKNAAALFKAIRKNEVEAFFKPDVSLLSKNNIGQFAAALAKNSNITTLDLYEADLGDEGAIALAAVLKKHPTIHNVRFAKTDIGPKGAMALAEAVAVNTAIKGINLSHNPIGDDGVIAFATIAKAHPSLTTLIFSSTESGDQSAIAIGAMLKSQTQFQGIFLADNNITDAGAFAIADGLRANRLIHTCTLDNNPEIGPEGIVALEEAIVSTNHKNMIRRPINDRPLGDPVDILCDANVEKAFSLRDVVEDFTAHTPADWHQAYARRGALANFTSAEKRQAFLDFLETLPLPDLDQPWEALLVKQGEYAPIDNPLIWQQFDRIVAAANEHGSYLRGPALLTADGTASVVLQRAIECEKVNELFIPENWVGATPAELNKVLRAIPPEIKETIPNLHTLIAGVAKQSSNQMRNT